MARTNIGVVKKTSGGNDHVSKSASNREMTKKECFRRSLLAAGRGWGVDLKSGSGGRSAGPRFNTRDINGRGKPQGRTLVGKV